MIYFTSKTWECMAFSSHCGFSLFLFLTSPGIWCCLKNDRTGLSFIEFIQFICDEHFHPPKTILKKGVISYCVTFINILFSCHLFSGALCTVLLLWYDLNYAHKLNYLIDWYWYAVQLFENMFLLCPVPPPPLPLTFLSPLFFH